MTIASLEALINHPSFQILANVQAKLDDKDPVLQKSRITRSPFQLLAFLFLWSITSEKSKEDVIKNIAKYCASCSPFKSVTKDDLDALVKELNWKKLFEKLNSTSKHFLKLKLPKQVIQSLGENSLVSICHIEEGEPDECCILSTIQQEIKWITPFSCKDRSHWWEIDKHTFSLSDGLIRELNIIKKQLGSEGRLKMPIEIGEFSILAERRTMMAAEPIEDTYALSINNNGSNKLTAALAETSVYSGLYNSFYQARLKGEFTVRKIKVNLEGNAYFNEYGMGVKQTQSAGVYSACAAPDFREETPQVYTHFDIKVSSIYMLSPQLIAVNFSSMEKEFKSEKKTCAPDIFITLNGLVNNDKIEWDEETDSFIDRRRFVKIYPGPLSHQLALETELKKTEGVSIANSHDSKFAQSVEITKPLEPEKSKHRIRCRVS